MIVLLTGAGLLLKSFARMRAVDPGFRSSEILTFGVSLSPAAFPITLRGDAHRSGDTGGCLGRALAGGVDRRPRADAPVAPAEPPAKPIRLG